MQKFNFIIILDKVYLIFLIEKGNGKKCEIVKEFNIPPNTIHQL